MQAGKGCDPTLDWATLWACGAGQGTRKFCMVGRKPSRFYLLLRDPHAHHHPAPPRAPALLASPKGKTTSLNHSPRFPVKLKAEASPPSTLETTEAAATALTNARRPS